MRPRIPLIDACDFPEEVEKWCVYHDVSIHYDHSVAWITPQDDVLWNWLVSEGEVEAESEGTWIAILST